MLGEVTALRYNGRFQASFRNANRISRVTLVRAGSTTHSLDMGQRFLELESSQSGGTLSIQAPERPELALPGHYLLFVFNEEGVPSEAQIVQMDGSGVAILSAPGNQQNEEH